MRVLTNERRVKRGRMFGTIMFFFSLFVLTGGLIFTNFIAISSEALFFVPCLVMPIGLLATIASVRMTNAWVRQPRPDAMLKEGLRGINRRSVLLNYFPGNPHILITPHGVYSITIRFQQTEFKVEGERWTNFRAKGPLGPLFLYMKQEQLGDPFADARRERDLLQAVVDKALPDAGIEVEPLVIFTDPRATLEIVDPAIPVAYATPKKRPSIKSLLREDRRDKQQTEFEELDDDEIILLENAVVALVPENQHAGLTEEDVD